MKKRSNKKPATKASSSTRPLFTLLRAGKNDLLAVWQAGEWLEKRFGGAHAGSNDVANLSVELKKKRDDDADTPVSASHLHKCRQLFQHWSEREIQRAQASGLSWRRAIALTSAKRLVENMNDSAVRRQLWVVWKKLSVAPKPGRVSASAWSDALADLKRRARSKNPLAYKLKQLKECVRTAKSRLSAAKGEIGKMREFISQKQWQRLRPIAPALTKFIERIDSFYATEREGKLKQTLPEHRTGPGRK